MWKKRFIGLLMLALGIGVFIALVFPAWLVLWVLGMLIVAAGLMLIC